jgi:hypothetical protein
MGILFALAFCPVSAAFFFGSLIPLALKQNSAIGLPLVYGIGTGLPVLGFALVVMFGVKQLGNVFQAVTKVEFWVRRATAAVMILVGVHQRARFYACPLQRTRILSGLFFWERSVLTIAQIKENSWKLFAKIHQSTYKHLEILQYFSILGLISSKYNTINIPV